MRAYSVILQEAYDFLQARRFDDAMVIFDKLLAHHDQDEYNLFCGVGTCLAALGHDGLGAHFLRVALSLKDDYSPLWNNLGTILRRVGRDDAAKQCFDTALKLNPDNAEALAGMSAWYVNRGMPQECIKWGRQAVAAKPSLPQAHMHLALGLLETGQFEEAWPHFQWGWELPERLSHKRPYKCPKWQGGPVNVLSVHGEQGLGDEILFMSCFRAAQARAGGRVIVECAQRLCRILEQSFAIPCYPDHASLIEAEGEPDAYVAMGALPMLVGLPDGRPYLERPLRNLAVSTGGFRVGLTWRGGTDKTNKRERSLKLEQLAAIYQTPGIDFVSVQYGEEVIDREAAACGIPQAFTGRSIDECAAAMAGCDLIISVCQTAVHLAGAMGIPCWVLTPKQCSWRYCGEGDTMMPWYRSVKLYRQDNSETWGPVIARIAAELPRLQAQAAG